MRNTPVAMEKDSEKATAPEAMPATETPLVTTNTIMVSTSSTPSTA